MTAVYCDESVWLPVAEGLRHRGWSVLTASEEGMLGVPDKEQLGFASRNEYVLLTFDDDFLSLVEREDWSHSGVIYVNQTGKRVGEIVKKIDELLDKENNIRQIHYL